MGRNIDSRYHRDLAQTPRQESAVYANVCQNSAAERQYSRSLHPTSSRARLVSASLPPPTTETGAEHAYYETSYHILRRPVATAFLGLVFGLVEDKARADL